MEPSDIRLLIIEDEPMVLESYVDMLELLGYKADTAINGKDGLAKIANKDYHIVITDLNMPVMDGTQTLKRIKAQYPDVEVIVATGFATIETAINAMKNGAFDYITKPVSLEHVKIVLNKCTSHIAASLENKELKDLNTQLRHVNEIKDKFITITNHELRTPLAVLKGYFELIEMSLEEKNEDIEEYMGIVGSTITEMIELVERMHNLSDSSKITVEENENFNLNDVVVSVANEMKILFNKRNISFGAFSNKKEIPVFANPLGIHKAIRELLQNALKFTAEGGTVELRAKMESDDNKVYVSVKDDGIGIAHDQKKYIFEPFYEAQDVMHHSTSQTDFMGGGIGVGLSLVQEVLKSCDGDIDVQSTPNKGSTFTIILPCAETLVEA